MDVELLTSDGCPHGPPAEARLLEVLERLAPGTSVSRTTARDAEHAAEVGFLGSPSIRVNGRDLEGRDGDPSSFSCRVYEGGDAPPVWLIEVAVLAAQRPRHMLFLCVANSARSQMAEGIARSLAAEGVRVSSAGSTPTSVRPEALEALSEIGIDGVAQHSKSVADLEGEDVDAVITLCAEEVCPAWLGPALRLHWGLPDPAVVEEPEARRESFQQVRDELRRRLGLLFEHLGRVDPGA